jgi:hypothetical protein
LGSTEEERPMRRQPDDYHFWSFKTPRHGGRFPAGGLGARKRFCLL